MPHTVVPRRITHLSDIGLGATVGGVVVMDALHFLPQVTISWEATMMVYLPLTAAAAVCGVGSVLGRCQLAIAQAFSAGVTAGQRAPVPAPPDTGRPPGLRAVD